MTSAELETAEKSFESIATSARYSLGLILVWSLLWFGALYVGEFSRTRHWLGAEGSAELNRYLGTDAGADQILAKRVDELYVKAPVIELTMPITDYGYFAAVALVLIALWLSNTSDREYDLLSQFFAVDSATGSTVTLTPKIGMTREHAWLISQWANNGRVLTSASGLGFQPSLFAFCVPLVPCTIQLAIDAMEVAGLNNWELLARRSLIHVVCFVIVAIALLHVLKQQLRTKALLDLVMHELEQSWKSESSAASLRPSPPQAAWKVGVGTDTPVVLGSTYASLTVVATALTFLVALRYEWHARTWIAVLLVVSHLILIATAFSSPRSRTNVVRFTAGGVWLIGVIAICALGAMTHFSFTSLTESPPATPDAHRWKPALSILMSFVGWFATTTGFPAQQKASVRLPSKKWLGVAVGLMGLLVFELSLWLPLLVAMCAAPMLGRMLLFERARAEKPLVAWALAAFTALFVLELMGLSHSPLTETLAYVTTLSLICSLAAITRAVAPEEEVRWWLLRPGSDSATGPAGAKT